MKKLSLYIMALLSFGLVACNDDYATEVGPQANEQEAALLPTDVTVTTGVQSIKIADFIDAVNGDDPITIGTVNLAKPLPANSILRAQVDFSDTEDFGKMITLNALDFDETNAINVSPSALQQAYYANITHNPNTKDVYVRTTLFVVTAQESEATVGTAGNSYFDVHKVSLTPVDTGVRLSSAYYIVGSPNNWAQTPDRVLDRTIATSVKFDHSDADVYDDPVFTVVIDAAYNEDGSRAETWFSILPENDLDQFLGGDWNMLVGNTKGNGTEELSGVLMSRSDFGGENNMKMPATDGAQQYQITLDVLEGTYEIKPLTAGAVFDTDPVLYLTGDHYNWGDPWVALAPVHSHPTVSWTILYLHEGEQFKFAPQAGWGNDFGMSATIIDNAGLNPSGTDNIVVGNAGWYLIKVDNTDGARTVEFLKPEVYLIGNTAAAGWDIAESGLFTIPDSEGGQFVSPAFAQSDEVRMCVKLDGIDWWQTEFIVNASGQIDYRGAGDDQARVSVRAGQKCYLNFANGAGVYK